MCVVVIDVFDDEAFELALVPDDGPIEQLAAQRADPAFSEAVRYRWMHRDLEDLGALGGEDRIEASYEL
jgi:hypothetical protein